MWAAPLWVPPLLPETSCRSGSSPCSRLQSHSFPLRGDGRRQAAEPGLDANPAWPRSRPQLTLGAIAGSPSPDCSPPMLAPTRGCRSTRQPPEMSVSWQRAQPGVPKPGSSSRGYLRDAAVVCVQSAEPSWHKQAPSWSRLLPSLGTRLRFWAGRQPGPIYPLVTLPPRLAFPPG